MTNPYDPNPSSGLESASSLSQSKALSNNVRNGQVITFGLIQSVVILTAIMFWLAGGPNAAPAEGDTFLLPILGVVLGCVLIVGSAVAVFVLRRRAIHNFHCLGETVATPVDETVAITEGISRLLAAAHTNLIVGLAILDGASVLNAILYFLEHHWINLAVVAICIVAMAAQWPTVGKRLDLIEAAARG